MDERNCKKENKSYAKKIIELSKYENFIDCSNLKLLEIIKCLKNCKFFVGNDSGPLNLSSALGIKSFGLVANTSAKQLENSNADIILSIAGLVFHLRNERLILEGLLSLKST